MSEKALEELTASVEEHGILTPLLVRPQNGHFEIAAGHRRYRAARRAGLETLPVIVREMSDQQFMEILTVENLQREDVHAYEEAQGYSELLKLPGYDVTSVAGKIGRSEAYVRSRLKLLDLSEEATEAFLADRITFAHARLIAPLPQEKQGEALKECFDRWGNTTRLLPAVDLKEWIQQGDGETLSDAPFSLGDAELVPEAGACFVCPKSTCGAGKLFADDTGDELCYDKKCFESKVDASVARQREAGLVAISTDWDAKKGHADAIGRLEYTRIDPRTSVSAAAESHAADDEVEEADPEETPCDFLEDAVIVSGHDRGSKTKICRNPECPVHGSAEKAEPGPSGADEWEKKRAADLRKKKAFWEKRRATYQTLCDKWAPVMDRSVFFLLVVDGLNRIQHTDLLKKISRELEVEISENPGDQRKSVFNWAVKANALQLRAAFIRLFFAEHVEREEWHRDHDLLAIAFSALKSELVDARPAAAEKPKATKKAAVKKSAKSSKAAKKVKAKPTSKGRK
jgi:ParB/RepB/Spo0J family partition protein